MKTEDGRISFLYELRGGPENVDHVNEKWDKILNIIRPFMSEKPAIEEPVAKPENLKSFPLTETTRGFAINMKDFSSQPDLNAWATKLIGLDPTSIFNREFLQKAPEREMQYGRIVERLVNGDIIEINAPQGRKYSSRNYYKVFMITDNSIELEPIAPLDAKKGY